MALALRGLLLQPVQLKEDLEAQRHAAK